MSGPIDGTPSAPERVDERRLADADALGSEILRLVRLLERTRAHLTSVPADGVEHAAYVLLCHLCRDGAMRASTLAEAVHSDPSTISRQVAALVRHGLVERRPDPEDGRACLVAATEEGTRVFECHRRIRSRHTAAMLKGWSPEERQQLLTLLARFNTDFENYRRQIVGAALDVPAPALQTGPSK